MAHQKNISFSERRKGFFSLILLSFVFASMGVFARYLNAEFTLFQQIYLRIFLAFLIALVLFWKDIRFERYLQLPRTDIFLLFFRAVTLYGGILLISEAFFHAKYGNVAFIASFPVLTLLGYFLFKEKFSRSKIFCISLAIIGLFLIGIKDISNILSFGYGELLALCSAFAFAISYVARKWHSNELSDKEMTVSIFLIGSTLVFLTSFFALGEQLPSVASFTPFMLFILIIAALFNVANLYLINYGFARVESAVAGNILSLETIFSLIIGFFLFSEIPVVREIIGSIIIFTSIIWLNKLDAGK